MSIRPVAAASAVESIRVSEDDVQCPICFQTVKDPVTPSYLSRFINFGILRIWCFGKLTEKQACIHFFCRECFERIEIHRCPMCRAKYTQYIPNQAIAQRVEQYVRETFNISSIEYFNEERLTRPTLNNVKILISSGKYADALELIKSLPSQAEAEEGYHFFVEHCKADSKVEELEKSLPFIPEYLRLKAVNFLILLYFQSENYEKIVQLSFLYPAVLESLSLPILSNMALFCVDRENSNKIQDLKMARHIADIILLKNPSESRLRDQVIASAAVKYYILGDKKKAEEEFFTLAHPHVFSADLFIKLFEEHLRNKKFNQAEALLNRMGSEWADERKSVFQRDIRQARSSQNKERLSCLTKVVAVGLVAISSLSLFYRFYGDYINFDSN